MPTYDYECENCGEQWEINVPIADRDNITKCGECNCDSVKRVISFKGLTWAPTAGGMR